MKQVAFRLLALVLGLIVALGLGEVIARVEGSYSRHLADVKRIQTWESTKDEREVVLDLPAERVIRIASIGDSFTYGVYLSAKDTWPEQLEHLLNSTYADKTDLRFDLLNYGRAGASLQTHLALLDLAEKNSSFAFVIQQLYINDATIEPYLSASGLEKYKRPPSIRVSGELPFHALYYLTKFLKQPPLYRNSFLEWHDQFDDGSLAHWPMMAKDFQSIIERVHARDAEMFTFLVPAQIWRDGVYRWSGMHDQITATLRPHADHYLDLTNFLMLRLDNGFDHWVLPGRSDAHPDARTHRLYAEAVFAELEQRKIPQKLIARQKAHYAVGPYGQSWEDSL